MATKRTPPKSAGALSENRRKAKPRTPPKDTSEQLDSPVDLRETDVPGVYLNRMNVRVDARGVALSFKQLHEKDQARFAQVLGHAVETPAQLLKAVALDPTQPLPVRIDSAKSAAPYFDRKQPTAIDGGLDPETQKPVPLFDPSKLSGLSTAELQQLRKLVAKGGGAEE